MGGGHHNKGPGFHPPHVSRIHRWTALGFGATAWFWILYRMKKEGAIMFGLKPPPWVEDVQNAGKATPHH